MILLYQVITDTLASRNVTEWLQRSALEELMEISSRLYRLLGGGLVSMKENGTLVDLILQILSATLKISQKRKLFQPHFTITIEGIFQLFEAVANCDSPQVEASAERGLDVILMSTPPIDIICMVSLSLSLSFSNYCEHPSNFGFEQFKKVFVWYDDIFSGRGQAEKVSFLGKLHSLEE